ncbi:MAG: hypothetical protein B7Y53_05605 [Halothiobacillus sp. 28-55-5]|nr:MAG: hypothetical protein B7Y53_05605 [Halothiobacillus sp. 28-55-5]
MSYRFLIESVTKSGARFRPSDWIDRLASWAMFDSVLQFADRNNLKVHVQHADGRLEEYSATRPPAADHPAP